MTTTALTVSAVNAPIRLFGSDGKTHLEYDLILQSMFNAPVTVTSIEVLAPDGASLLKLDDDQVAKFTTPAFTGPPTAVVPPSGALGTVIDIVVPPDNVPDPLNHRISYRPGTSELGSIVGTRDIVGPELDVDLRAPVPISSPLKGQAWLNANSCCVPSRHTEPPESRWMATGSRSSRSSPSTGYSCVTENCSMATAAETSSGTASAPTCSPSPMVRCPLRSTGWENRRRTPR